ncbi:unnamed protein product [Heligmosomoides polygyrus]|uniref:MMPL domain-containing protein n=1 Tax=Heligmosomoides polygyrus TaxID=6339 RepID=A0A183GHQ2_HELPZ|nr:unnamed protein product [Heligmosomoides polygyrus]
MGSFPVLPKPELSFPERKRQPIGEKKQLRSPRMTIWLPAAAMAENCELSLFDKSDRNLQLLSSSNLGIRPECVVHKFPLALYPTKRLGYPSISDFPHEHKGGVKWEKRTHQLDPPQGLMFAHVSVFGCLVYLDIDLDPISMTTQLMAIGFSVVVLVVFLGMCHGLIVLPVVFAALPFKMARVSQEEPHQLTIMDKKTRVGRQASHG